MPGQIVAIRDFTIADAVIRFQVNDDVFEALPDIPLTIMQDMTKMMNLREAVTERGVEAILDVTDLFLTDTSATRFRHRVLEDRVHPIGVKTFMAILPWLLEQYGLRPTQPSSNSSTGLSDGETGTSSMDGVLPGDLIPSPSLPTEH